MRITSKRIILLFGVVLILPFSLKSQEDSTKVYSLYKGGGTFDELSLIAGYSINKRNEKNKGEDNHIIELGVYKSRNSYYIETAGYSYLLSNEFMFNKNSFHWGPKIGGFFHIWMVYLGTELVFYTNFSGQTLQIAPIFGFGYSRFKVGMGLHVPLVNNLFDHTNIMSIGFTYEIKNIQKKKIKL